MHEENQTGRDLRDRNVSSNVCPKRIEVPETDMSPAKTLIFSRKASTSEQRVSKGAVDVSELSSRSDDGMSVSQYCAEKLRSFGASELQTLVEVGEKPIEQTLYGLNISGEAADVLGVSHDKNSTAPLKQRD